eukprot:12220749-Ditylum_brightwellii.AAC.1
MAVSNYSGLLNQYQMLQATGITDTKAHKSLNFIFLGPGLCHFSEFWGLVNADEPAVIIELIFPWRPLTVRQRGSCPNIQATSAATKSSAQQPKPLRRPRQRGSPPKAGVAQKGAEWERHLWFLEGKGIGRYYT